MKIKFDKITLYVPIKVGLYFGFKDLDKKTRRELLKIFRETKKQYKNFELLSVESDDHKVKVFL